MAQRTIATSKERTSVADAMTDRENVGYQEDQAPINDTMDDHKGESIDWEGEPSDADSGQGSVTPGRMLRDYEIQSRRIANNLLRFTVDIVITRATVTFMLGDYEKTESHALNAIRISRLLRSPSLYTRCQYIRAVALYYQQRFGDAHEAFVQAGDCSAAYGISTKTIDEWKQDIKAAMQRTPLTATFALEPEMADKQIDADNAGSKPVSLATNPVTVANDSVRSGQAETVPQTYITSARVSPMPPTTSSGGLSLATVGEIREEGDNEANHSEIVGPTLATGAESEVYPSILSREENTPQRRVSFSSHTRSYPPQTSFTSPVEEGPSGSEPSDIPAERAFNYRVYTTSRRRRRTPALPPIETSIPPSNPDRARAARPDRGRPRKSSMKSTSKSASLPNRGMVPTSEASMGIRQEIAAAAAAAKRHPEATSTSLKAEEKNAPAIRPLGEASASMTTNNQPTDRDEAAQESKDAPKSRKAGDKPPTDTAASSSRRTSIQGGDETPYSASSSSRRSLLAGKSSSAASSMNEEDILAAFGGPRTYIDTPPASASLQKLRRGGREIWPPGDKDAVGSRESHWEGMKASEMREREKIKASEIRRGEKGDWERYKVAMEKEREKLAELEETGLVERRQG